MSNQGFLELIIPSSYFSGSDPVEDRQEIEEALDLNLSELNLGEVSGGSSGEDVVIIYIEVFGPSHLGHTIREILDFGRRLGLPAKTRILQHQPHERAWPLYEAD